MNTANTPDPTGDAKPEVLPNAGSYRSNYRHDIGSPSSPGRKEHDLTGVISCPLGLRLPTPEIRPQDAFGWEPALTKDFQRFDARMDWWTGAPTIDPDEPREPADLTADATVPPTPTCWYRHDRSRPATRLGYELHVIDQVDRDGDLHA